MTSERNADAIIIGSGPNGLAAAITLAQAGLSVLVREGAPKIGGGTRSEALTLDGFTHDVCSTVHTLARVSPFLRTLPLAEHGLELLDPPAPFAHPFDDGTAAVAEQSIEATCETLGADAAAYRQLLAPLVEHWRALMEEILAPPHLPRSPVKLGRFGLRAIQPVKRLCDRWFRESHARGLFAGVAAHAMLPFDRLGGSAFGLMLILSAHAAGWPVAKGGSQKVAEALASILRSCGGSIVTDAPVANIDELPRGKLILCDITPLQFLRLARHRLPARYMRRLERFRYGPGAFKMDWALSQPIPWRAEACRRAGTIHLGGTLEAIAASEAATWAGRPPENPYVLLVQPTIADPTRAPANQHTAWAYCHIPNGSTFDMTERMERQIERFAPGFRDIILARSIRNPVEMERYNPNLVGGDVNAGSADIYHLFTRPIASFNPYATPLKDVYLCSASTPPGGGVHGMCGHHAARAALRAIGQGTPT